MKCVWVIVFVLAAAAILTVGQCSDTGGVSVALRLYEECSKTDGFSPCIKKKAVTLLNRLARMQKLPIAEGITLVHQVDSQPEPTVTEDELDATLPRGLDAKDDALTDILVDKATKLIGSSTIEISPRMIMDEVETARLGGGGGKGGGKGGKKGGMMGGMMMMMAGKLAGLIPLAIAGLFLLAGKALITAKIALLLSGIIALKKLFAGKNSAPHVEHVQASHGYHTSGGGGGHGGGGHGGWDKRSLDDAQQLAYKAQKPL